MSRCVPAEGGYDTQASGREDPRAPSGPSRPEHEDHGSMAHLPELRQGNEDFNRFTLLILPLMLSIDFNSIVQDRYLRITLD